MTWVKYVAIIPHSTDPIVIGPIPIGSGTQFLRIRYKVVGSRSPVQILTLSGAPSNSVVCLHGQCRSGYRLRVGASAFAAGHPDSFITTGQTLINAGLTSLRDRVMTRAMPESVR